MSTIPNPVNNKPTTGESDRAAHPPKKRSLSSYLSKLSARKEELEKLKHTDDKIVVPPAETVLLDTKQDVKEEDKPKTKPVPVTSTFMNVESKPEHIDKASTTIESITKPIISTMSEDKTTETPNTRVTKQAEPANIAGRELAEPLSEKIETNEVLKTNIMELSRENKISNEQINETTSQHTPTTLVTSNTTSDHQSKSNEAQQHQHQVELESRDNSHLTIFSRDELKSVLKDPSFLASSPQKNTSNLYELTTEETQKKKKHEYKEKQHEHDINEMIDSDAETPNGSPIKVKKGRLIRGDKLQHLTSLLNSVTFNNDSDSELSDVADTKDISITSSFLNESSTKNNINKPKENKQTSPLKKVIKRNLTNSHIAISKGSKNKKSVYRDAGGRTRLQIACEKGKLDVVKKLLDDVINNPNSNIDINDQDNAGNTPLHEAALNGHLDIVELLLAHGANVNIQSFEYFKDTPLIDASANGHLEVVEYLLTKGADPTITNARGLTAYEAIDEEDSELDEEEKELVKDIKTALRNGTQSWTNAHNSATKTLGTQESKELKKQHSNNHRNNNGQSSNDNNNGDGQNFSDDSMGKNTAIEFFWTDLTSKAGKDKLMRASKEGYLAYVGQYLENGGRIDFKSFLESVRFGHEDIASLYLAFGAQVNKLNRDDYTPLMVAVGRGHFGTVKLLVEAGADPTIKNKKGHTALYYARNSPVGVVDDDEIGLLIQSIKSYGGSIEEDGHTLDEAEQEVEETETERPKPIKEKNIIKSSKSSELISKIEEEKEKLDHTIISQKSTSISAIIASSEDPTTAEDSKPANKTKLESIFDDDNSSSNNTDVNFEKRSIEPRIKENSSNKKIRDASEKEEDDDEPEIPTSKYKHSSPSLSSIPRKRSISADNGEISQNNELDVANSSISGTPSTPAQQQQQQHEDKKLKVEHVETEKEKQERLKSEEEYLQRKIQNKRRKELELIQKLQEDEKKRVEEKEKAKLEEAKKLELLFKAKELELEKKEKEIEIEKRRRIRSMYPLGLKLIKFDGEIDLASLPLYYVVKNSVKYVLDLQLLVILRNSEIIPQSIESIAITEPDDKLQLWNIHKQTFLFGGLQNNITKQYTKIFNETSSLSQRLQFENEEYQKFIKLPMNWIRWETMLSQIEDPEAREKLQSNMLELSSLSNDKTAVPRNIAKRSSHHSTKDKYKNFPLTLPIRLQHRPQVVRLLKHERLTESQPLW